MCVWERVKELKYRRKWWGVASYTYYISSGSPRVINSKCLLSSSVRTPYTGNQPEVNMQDNEILELS